MANSYKHLNMFHTHIHTHPHTHQHIHKNAHMRVFLLSQQLSVNKSFQLVISLLCSALLLCHVMLCLPVCCCNYCCYCSYLPPHIVHIISANNTFSRITPTYMCLHFNFHPPTVQPFPTQRLLRPNTKPYSIKWL